MKALVATFNQEKALVEAFSMIVKSTRRSVASSTRDAGAGGGVAEVPAAAPAVAQTVVAGVIATVGDSNQETS